LPDLAAMEVDELVEVVQGYAREPVAVPIVRTFTERLRHLVEIGLEYLSLDRATDTLSGGEVAAGARSSSTQREPGGVMYIFDDRVSAYKPAMSIV